MARGKTLTVVFKSNYQNQGMLLPPDLNDLVAFNHPIKDLYTDGTKIEANANRYTFVWGNSIGRTGKK